ncbi:MAG: class I SAM-dependent methyltransferase [Myxococcales bacterium]|nr:class I SAM-dependent methyltransferase [Myxococcales bacterium]
MDSDDVVEAMQAYYARRAPHYDQSMGYDREPSHALREVIDLLCGGMRDREVLEIACGPCFWTSHVAHVACRILATDYNQETLDQARDKDLPWSRVELRLADAYALPSLPGPFDGAFMVDWFSHVPISRQDAFLEGLHSHLRGGARVMVCDQLPRPGALTNMQDSEGNHLQRRQLPDGSRHTIIKRYLAEQEARQVFQRYTERVDVHLFPGAFRYVIEYCLPS